MESILTNIHKEEETEFTYTNQMQIDSSQRNRDRENPRYNEDDVADINTMK